MYWTVDSLQYIDFTWCSTGNIQKQIGCYFKQCVSCSSALHGAFILTCVMNQRHKERIPPSVMSITQRGRRTEHVNSWKKMLYQLAWCDIVKIKVNVSNTIKSVCSFMFEFIYSVSQLPGCCFLCTECVKRNTSWMSELFLCCYRCNRVISASFQQTHPSKLW